MAKGAADKRRELEVTETAREINGWDDALGYGDVPALVEKGYLFVISHSSGKDSQAMYLALKRAGVPTSQMLVVYAILPDDLVWKGNADHIKATIDDGVPFILAKAQTPNPELQLPGTGNKSFWKVVDAKGEAGKPCLPDNANRWCNSDFKRGPINREVNKWAREHGYDRIVMAMGLRGLESANRAKLPVWDVDKGLHGKTPRGGKRKRVWLRWCPILNWTAKDTFVEIANAGQEPHWIYKAGMRRCSCAFCIFGCERDARTAAIIRPKLFNEYVTRERKYDHTLMMPKKEKGKTLRFFLDEYAGLTVEEAFELNAKWKAGEKLDGIIPVGLENPIGDPTLPAVEEPCDNFLVENELPKKKLIIVIDRTGENDAAAAAA